MEKKNIVEFFDRCAPWWDSDMIRNEELIAAILNNGGVRPGFDDGEGCGGGNGCVDGVSASAHDVGTDLGSQMAGCADDTFIGIHHLTGGGIFLEAIGRFHRESFPAQERQLSIYYCHYSSLKCRTQWGFDDGDLKEEFKGSILKVYLEVTA